MLNPEQSHKQSKSSDRDMSYLLTHLQQQLSQIQQDISGLRCGSQETLTHVYTVGQSAQPQLGQIRQLLKKQVDALHKRIKISHKIDEIRNKEILQNCEQLWESTEQIKANLFEIDQKVSIIEQCMG